MGNITNYKRFGKRLLFVFFSLSQTAPDTRESANRKCSDIVRILYVALILSADIVCITETWLSANIADSVVDISDYTIVRKDRILHKRGGGVCAFIKSSIGFTIIEELDNPLFECLWLYLRPPRLPRGFSCIIICIIYHPPLDDEAAWSC